MLYAHSVTENQLYRNVALVGGGQFKGDPSPFGYNIWTMWMDLNVVHRDTKGQVFQLGKSSVVLRTVILMPSLTNSTTYAYSLINASVLLISLAPSVIHHQVQSMTDCQQN